MRSTTAACGRTVPKKRVAWPSSIRMVGKFSTSRSSKRSDVDPREADLGMRFGDAVEGGPVVAAGAAPLRAQARHEERVVIADALGDQVGVGVEV